MTDHRDIDFLIVGGGSAGYSCAKALREAGGEGSIMLVSREPDPPYDRTLASKGYLRGGASRSDALLATPDWWEQQGIELLTRTSVMRLDPGARTATLQTKQVVGFRKALIATGALVRRLRVEGAQLEGIHYLRSLGNSDQIRADAERAERVVLIGGSYIATEVAASLTELGKRCTLVMQESVTLERSFGRTAGRFFQSELERHGVTVHGDDELDRFEGEGRVRKVHTRGGLELDADLVIVGAGVTPDTALARSAGLDIGEGGGILVDERLETSSAGIFAAGDACEYPSAIHERALRVEHWELAAAHGRRAAAAMADRELPAEEVPYFFSDLADWTSLEYVGPAMEWDEEVVRGSLDDGEFSVWYLHGGQVAAVLAVGRPEDLEAGRRLLLSHAELDPEAIRAGELQ